MEAQKTPNSQSNPEQKEQCLRHHNTWFKLHYRNIVTKTARHCHKTNWHIGQRNRIEDPEINPHSYVHLIIDKGVKSVLWRNDGLFNKWCCKNWISTCRKLKLDPDLSSYTKTISKWIKEHYVKTVTLKLLQEKNRENTSR
jgi:hypothetical protein